MAATNHAGSYKKPIDPAILQAEPGKVVRLEIQNCPQNSAGNG